MIDPTRFLSSAVFVLLGVVVSMLPGKSKHGGAVMVNHGRRILGLAPVDPNANLVPIIDRTFEELRDFFPVN